jgi:hypothetical protein
MRATNAGRPGTSSNRAACRSTREKTAGCIAAGGMARGCRWRLRRCARNPAARWRCASGGRRRSCKARPEPARACRRHTAIARSRGNPCRFRERRGARCASRYVEDLLKFGGAGVEAGLAFEWIAGVDTVEIVDGERLILRFDGEPEIAPGAPPERLEAPPRSAIGDEDVLRADELLAFDFVAVALIAEAGEPQRLRIAQIDLGVLCRRSRSVADIRWSERSGRTARWPWCAAGSSWERAARPQHRDRLRRQFHRRDGARHQHPAIWAILRIARRAGLPTAAAGQPESSKPGCSQPHG